MVLKILQRAEPLSVIQLLLILNIQVIRNLGNTLINVLRAEEAIEILEKGLELDSIFNALSLEFIACVSTVWVVIKRVGVITRLDLIARTSKM